jgi:spermidine/putrescine transport system ATP-binding protein
VNFAAQAHAPPAAEEPSDAPSIAPGPAAAIAATRASGDKAAAVELVDAVKRYGDAVALDRVSLTIQRGEFFCLLGPSGCGKTTTLNLIGGFIPLTSGELRIDGRRVNELPPHKRNVNTVFQSYALFPHMTVEQNVAFGPRMSGVRADLARSRVRDYLTLVGLEGLGGRYPSQLSGGQQQRVALARALIKEPAVLLLDEPLGALDLKLRKQMQLELGRIHRQVRTTFVFVTHDQEEALSLATRIAVMSGGRVVQEGAPREIYYRPSTRFVADFIGDSNFLSGSVERGPGGAWLASAGGERVAVAADVPIGAVTLMIRPEVVKVSATPPDDGSPALAGRLVGISFLGAYTRLAVETAAGTVVAAPPNAGGERSASLEQLLDQEVCVWWSAADAVVISHQ